MKSSKRESYSSTKDRYELLRISAREDAMETMPLVMPNGKGQGVNVRGEVLLTGIDFKATIEASKWLSSPVRQPTVGISWPYIINKYARVAPKRFELAIWHRNTILCGLALGKPTRSGNKLRLDFIEASPEKSPISGAVTDITIIAMKAYAYTIGASEIRIMKPINEKVKNHYLEKSRGFSYNDEGNYCYQEL